MLPIIQGNDRLHSHRFPTFGGWVWMVSAYVDSILYPIYTKGSRCPDSLDSNFTTDHSTQVSYLGYNL